MNCHQWNLPEFIHPVKSAALFIYLFIFRSAVDVSVLIAGCCETALVSPAHIWHPWSSGVSLRCQFFKALKYFFSLPFLFYFFMCRWKRLYWPFQALFGWNTEITSTRVRSAERNIACQTGYRWRGDRGEGGWWGRWEGTSDDQHLWELSEFLLQHHWTCPHLALEAQKTITGNHAEVFWTCFQKCSYQSTPHQQTAHPHKKTHTVYHLAKHRWSCTWRSWDGVVTHCCEAAKFSMMPLETAHGREMTIQFGGNSFGGSSGHQRANCPRDVCYFAFWYATPVEAGEVLTNTDLYGFVNTIWEK